METDLPVVVGSGSLSSERDSFLGPRIYMRGKWQGLRFERCQFSNFWWTDGHLCDALFEDCQMERWGFRFCRLSRVTFRNCSFNEGSIIWGCILQEVVVEGEDLPRFEEWNSAHRLRWVH